MSKEGIPKWIHDKFEISSEETTDEDEFVSRLGKLQKDPEVLSKLDNVLKEAYEKAYGEVLDLGSSEEVESDDVPFNQEPAPGMEDVDRHWETSSRELMSFKELHEKSKTVSNKGHPNVKCQACGKALNSMSLASFWQHVESKNCYPQRALEFWKKEHFQAKAEREAKAEGEASKKRPMDDAESKDEKKRQEIAKDEEKKKRKQHFEEHYERFRYKGKDDVKPEVKKIPRRPGEKEKEKEAKREEKERSEKEDAKSPSRAPIELKSISPSRAPQDSRADSAQASKGKGKISTGAKRFLEKAVREAANFMERKVRKKKEKSPSPKLREHSPGGGVRSDSDLDFLGSLASPVDTIVWATVDSGAATSCLPKEMAQSLELAMTPVDEKPFTNASGQPVQVHGVCNPMVTMGEKGGPQVKGVGQFRAMDVAKPLLSVSKLVEKGWTVTFGPKGSFLQRGAKKVPITMTGGVFKSSHGFSWAAHRRVEGVSPVETTESAGSGDDEPGSSKLGSQALPTAAAPTQREKEEHFVSHYPFRSWCEHCIRGKAKAMRHVKVDHSDETVPVISADYCFMNSVDDTVITEEVQKKHAPVLIIHDRWSKLTYAHVLPYKGVTQGPIGSKCLLNDLKKFGYPKMVMRYDPEPALNSVVEAAKNGFDKQLVLEKVPKGVSESKGEIERAVQAIESQSRTLRSALETSYGRKVPDDHPVLTWLVEHASTTYNLFHRSLEVKDGKTPYSRHRGREWRVSLPPFGETIEFLKRGHKFEQRWHQGVFLGVKDNTTEKIVGNASGVFTVQSIRRKSADDRYDVETLMSVTGVPWDPQASKRDDILLPQIVGGDQQPLAPSVPVEPPKKSTRRLYITKRDLDKYGYTAGCVACDATRIGTRGTGVHHTPACRERMERLLQAEEGNLRVAQHTAKVDSEITGQKQEVSEEGTKILYGYSSERPQGVPQGFKVFARLDRNARYLKGTMPEGPSWDNVWWRVTRDFKTGDIIKSEPIDPNLGEDVINAPLIDDTDIITELWYSATGESAPSLPTAGPSCPETSSPSSYCS